MKLRVLKMKLGCGNQKMKIFVALLRDISPISSHLVNRPKPIYHASLILFFRLFHSGLMNNFYIPFRQRTLEELSLAWGVIRHLDLMAWTFDKALLVLMVLSESSNP